MGDRVYKLSPSDFSFLYEGCKRCFYLKVVHKIPQPSIPLPGVFSKMAALLKDHYTGKGTQEVHPALAPGVVKYGEQWVRSEPIRVPGHDATCFINGRFDIVTDFSDGSYGVIDFKTGNPKEEYAELYGRQLHAYAYALEHPARGALHLSPVTQLGLLYFYPSRVNQVHIEDLSYEADISWIPIKKDEERFLRFIGEVLAVLESPRPPAPSPTCMWCAYVDKLGNKK
jgi:CRISPR/Cas system-associated exonuclease Cas4 (RecB family)